MPEDLTTPTSSLPPPSDSTTPPSPPPSTTGDSGSVATHQLTDIGKLFIASLYKWLTHPGTKFNWKLKGNPEFVKAFLNVVEKSKAFQDEANKPEGGTTVEKLMQKMQEKNKAAKDFEERTGINFPF